MSAFDDRNDGQYPENDEFEVADASDVTINCVDSGIDTATTRYLGMGRNGYGVIIRPQNNNVQVVSMDSHVFKSPITISTAGLAWTRRCPWFKTIVLRFPVASSVVRVWVI